MADLANHSREEKKKDDGRVKETFETETTRLGKRIFPDDPVDPQTCFLLLPSSLGLG